MPEASIRYSSATETIVGPQPDSKDFSKFYLDVSLALLKEKPVIDVDEYGGPMLCLAMLYVYTANISPRSQSEQ